MGASARYWLCAFAAKFRRRGVQLSVYVMMTRHIVFIHTGS